MQVGRAGATLAAWRTGEEHVSNLAFSGGQPAEMRANPAYGRTGRAVRRKPRGAKGGACGRLASWWGNGSPGRRSVAGLRGRAATLGLRTAQTPTGGSSEESSAMGATLTERRRVREDGLRVVNRFSVGRDNRTVPQEEASANYVPAAAVIRRRRALSGVTGRKGCAGGGSRG